MNTDRFSKTLTSADANNIVLLLSLPQELAYYEQFKAENIVEHAIILEDLHVKVGLFNLLEAGWEETNALASDAAVQAARAKIMTEGQKIYLEILTAKGNGPWEVGGEEILQNKNSIEQPWTLMPLFSTNATALLGENLKIGVRIANRAQGVGGGLKGSDYLRIFGSWRKVTTITKKKDDDEETLAARVVSVSSLLPNTPFELVPARINQTRRGLIIYNSSDSVAVISYGTAVSSSVYSAKINPDGYFEDSTLGWQGAYWALSQAQVTLNVTEVLAT